MKSKRSKSRSKSRSPPPSSSVSSSSAAGPGPGAGASGAVVEAASPPLSVGTKKKKNDPNLRLWKAIEDDNWPLAQQLIVSDSANVNALNGSGWTPLHKACLSGRCDAVEMLLSYDASIDPMDNYGWTPLHWACLNGHLDVIQFLASKGADLNAVTPNGETPLYRTCFKGHLQVVEWLVANGANLELRDADGETPLHLACFWGHFDVVQFLVSKGANLNVTNNDGQTPIQLAQQRGETALVEYLEAQQVSKFAYLWKDQIKPEPWMESIIFDEPQDVNHGKLDFFISHRGPDTKATLAQPLHYILEKLGVSSFVDVKTIRMGEFNAVEMARGLYECKYGVVLISDNFLESKWCRRELNTLYVRHQQEQQKLGGYKLLAFFDHARLIKSSDYEGLNKIGAFVRPSGISDRQYLVRDIVPQLLEHISNNNNNNNNKKKNGISYDRGRIVELLDEYLAQEGVTIPASLRGEESLKKEVQSDDEGSTDVQQSKVKPSTKRKLKKKKSNLTKTSQNVSSTTQTSKFLSRLFQKGKTTNTSGLLVCLVEELSKLVSDLNDLKLFAALVMMTSRSSKTNKVEPNCRFYDDAAPLDWEDAQRYIQGALRKAVTFCHDSNLIATYKLILEYYCHRGILNDHKRLQLENEAEVHRTDNAPLVKTMTQQIQQNASLIEGLKGSVDNIIENIKIFEEKMRNVKLELDVNLELDGLDSAMRRRMKIEGSICIICAVLNAVTFGGGDDDELDDVFDYILNSAVDLSCPDHIRNALKAVGCSLEHLLAVKAKNEFEQGFELAKMNMASLKTLPRTDSIWKKELKKDPSRLMVLGIVCGLNETAIMASTSSSSAAKTSVAKITTTTTGIATATHQQQQQQDETKNQPMGLIDRINAIEIQTFGKASLGALPMRVQALEDFLLLDGTQSGSLPARLIKLENLL